MNTHNPHHGYLVLVLVATMLLGGCGGADYETAQVPPPPPQPAVETAQVPPPPPQPAVEPAQAAEPYTEATPPPPAGAQQPAPAPPPAAEAAPAQPALPAQPAGAPLVYSYPTGQWVYMAGRGWVWIPAGAATQEVDGAPYVYLYTPTYGWTWYLSPWGWGPYRYGVWVQHPWHPVGWHGYWVAHPRVSVRLGRGRR